MQKPDNDLNKMLLEQKLEWEQERRRQKEKARVISVVIFSFFLGLGVSIAFAFLRPVSTAAFIAAMLITFLFALVSGSLETYRIKKHGPPGGIFSFSLLQILLYIGMCVLLIVLLEALS